MAASLIPWAPQCLALAVSEMAASRKEAKYTTLWTHYDFQPIPAEALGPINESATSFLYHLGQ